MNLRTPTTRSLLMVLTVAMMMLALALTLRHYLRPRPEPATDIRPLPAASADATTVAGPHPLGPTAGRPVNDHPRAIPAGQRPTPAPTPTVTTRQGDPPPPVFATGEASRTAPAAEVYAALREAQRQPAADALAQGRTYLGADDARLRSYGAALLIMAGVFEDRDWRAVMTAGDLTVALNTLGWLRDLGYGEQAGAMMAALTNIPTDTAQLLALFESGPLLPAGQRFLLDLLVTRLPADTALSWLLEVAADDQGEHSVRLKSLILLRGHEDFESYREQVRELTEAATTTDWRQALKRFEEQLVGPEEVLTAPPVLEAGAIEERLERPYATMLDDLALHIEYVLGIDGHLVADGSASALQAYLDELRTQTLSPEEWMGLKRLEALQTRLTAAEQR